MQKGPCAGTRNYLDPCFGARVGSVLGIMVRWGVLDDADMNKNMDGGSLCTDAGWKGDGKQRYAFKAHIWFSGRPKGIM